MNPAAVLQIYVNAQTGPAVRGLMRVNTSLEATEKRSNKAVTALKSIGKTAAVGGIVGVGAAAVYSAKKAADFEQQMDSLGSVSGATGKQMQRFQKQALAAGAATKFSALDAARAQTELAKGGLGVAQIMRGGLKSALALAAAGEMELADAASTTANAMNLFGLEGKNAMKVADMLATAANATTADVSDFAMALTQGGSVAKMAGLSFKETVLWLEAMAKSGIKNSDAGTSLKTALIQLLKPSAKQAELAQKLGLNFIDASGKMKTAADVSAMLRDRLGGMTKAQRTAALATLAGTDGVRTLSSLYAAGVPHLDKWKTGLGKSGTAAQVAAQKQNNLKGQLENLRGSIETLAIKLGLEMLPALTSATRAVTRFINQMSSGKGKGGEFAAALKDIWPVVRTLFIWFGKAAGAVISWQRITSKSIRAIGDFFTNVWNRPKKAFGDLLAAILRGFAKLFDAASHLPGVGNKFKDFAAKARSSANQVDRLGEEIRNVPSKKQVKIQVDLLLKDFGAGKVPKLQPLDRIGDGIGLEGRIDAGVRRKVQAGVKSGAIDPFGLGPIGPLGMGGAASVDAFTPFASRFGLAMTSGFRPGSITSSGNLSLHALNRARDYGGSGGAMLAFARFMASKFGGKLTELIHTPMGFGIKNGQRISSFGAQVDSDHYDHVHVALQRGGMIPGQGSGDKVPVWAEPGEGFINKRAVAAMGGPAAIAAINKAKPRWGQGISGKELPSFMRAVWKHAGPMLGAEGSVPWFGRGKVGRGSFAESWPGGVHVSRGMMAALADPRNARHGYALQTLFHELAHTQQDRGLTRREQEGGAEAWAAYATHPILRKLGINPGPLSGPQSYYKQVAWVKQNRGADWWKRKQFRGFASGGVVAKAAYAAGFRGPWLQRMVAEAKGESGWNERAVGDGGASKGLWQIHLPSHPWAAGLNLFDPFVNAKAAMRIFRSQGVGAWHAPHAQHMAAAAAAIRSMGRGGGGGARRGGSSGTVTGGGRGPKEAFIGSGLSLADRITKAQGVLEAAEATGVLDDDTAARGELIGLHRTRAAQIRTRLRKINRALGGRKASVAARRRLTAERSTLLGELNTTRGEIRSLGAPVEGAEDTALIDAQNAAAEAARFLAEQIVGLRAESKQQADRQEYLVTRQGPQLVAALTMALSGNMGRTAALARRTAAAPGRVASL